MLRLLVISKGSLPRAEVFRHLGGMGSLKTDDWRKTEKGWVLEEA